MQNAFEETFAKSLVRRVDPCDFDDVNPDAKDHRKSVDGPGSKVRRPATKRAFSRRGRISLSVHRDVGLLSPTLSSKGGEGEIATFLCRIGVDSKAAFLSLSSFGGEIPP